MAALELLDPRSQSELALLEVQEHQFLESVTVEAVFEAARADGVETRYELVPVVDLYTADGLWLVSSGRGPALVTTLDGRALRADPDLARRIARYSDF